MKYLVLPTKNNVYGYYHGGVYGPDCKADYSCNADYAITFR